MVPVINNVAMPKYPVFLSIFRHQSKLLSEIALTISTHNFQTKLLSRPFSFSDALFLGSLRESLP